MTGSDEPLNETPGGGEVGVVAVPFTTMISSSHCGSCVNAMAGVMKQVATTKLLMLVIIRMHGPRVNSGLWVKLTV